MHRKRLRFALGCALVALVVAVPAAMGGAASGASVRAAEAEGTGLWFVELSGTPAKFRAGARSAGVAYSERFAFTKLWNGVSVKAGKAAIDEIRGLDGVKAVYPVYTAELGPTNLGSPEMATALAMTGADIAQSELGFTGEGIKVAIMDTGIDYDHADLGGDGIARQNSTVFPTARVTHGWDFVGDAFDANPNNPTYNPNPVPDPYPDDCNGHGTHVAGIVGANAAGATGVTGVAPDVTFGAYRVFGCVGSTTADIMIAAMERALADGMHILNMSIGSAFMTWPQYPTAAAADALVDEGMVVVASIGNSGANGVYSAGAPGVGRNVIGVASFDNSHVALTSFSLSTGEQIGYGNAAAAPTAPTEGTLPLAKTGTPADNADACDAIAADMSGKAVLIRRGTCPFHTKALNAQNAGAAAVVLYNNAPGRFSPTVAGTPAITIPVVAVSDAEGVTINDRIDAGPVDLIWSDETLVSENPTGGLISGFSSYGMTAELDLKPDIGAPGGLIRAPYPLESGAYATISGTSMSAPHVAGAAALLMQAKPLLAAADFRTVLQNSAEPKVWQGNPGLGFLDQVHRQGAGMVQIDRSILATTTVTPAKWAINDRNAGPVNSAAQTLTLSNSGSSAVTYDISHVAALSTGGATNAPGAFTANQAVTLSVPSVTVPAGGTASVEATVNIAAPALGRQYGGYIVFTPQGDGTPLRVPYAGFQGNYLDVRVLEPTANEFPWLTKLQDGFFVRQDEGAVYTLAGGDIPYVIAHFRHQSRRLELVLLDAATDAPVVKKGNVNYRASVVEADYLSRNSTATAIFAFAWDGRIDQVNPNGKTVRRATPNGQYKLQLKVLKALGDASNASHWETWTSPMFRIAR
jgi:minor extracellular serine protease Vpr